MINAQELINLVLVHNFLEIGDEETRHITCFVTGFCSQYLLHIYLKYFVHRAAMCVVFHAKLKLKYHKNKIFNEYISTVYRQNPGLYIYNKQAGVPSAPLLVIKWMITSYYSVGYSTTSSEKSSTTFLLA